MFYKNCKLSFCKSLFQFTLSLKIMRVLLLLSSHSVQFSRSFVTDSLRLHGPAHQTFLSITNSRSLLKLMSIVSVIPSNQLILCRPLLLLPSIFPIIRVFSNESVLCIRWSKYWSFSLSTSPSNEYIQDWFSLGLTGWVSLATTIMNIYSLCVMPFFFSAQFLLFFFVNNSSFFFFQNCISLFLLVFLFSVANRITSFHWM